MSVRFQVTVVFPPKAWELPATLRKAVVNTSQARLEPAGPCASRRKGPEPKTGLG